MTKIPEHIDNDDFWASIEGKKEMTKMDIQKFRGELKDLLKKYNASINFSVSDCSDTYGLSGEKMVVSVRPDMKSFKEIDILEVRGWSIDAGDIE